MSSAWIGAAAAIFCAVSAPAAEGLGARPDTPDAIPAWTGFGGLHQGCNGVVRAIASLPGGDIVVGGYFSVCGDVRASNIARWDGSQWHALADANG